MSIPGLILAIALALIHAFSSKLLLPKFIPRHRWLSFASGVSICYVFLEVLPKLGQTQTELKEASFPMLAFLENHVYVVALAGLAVFYGLDILALNSRSTHQKTGGGDSTSSAVFWIHILAFALLNAILGYLLQALMAHSLFTCVLFFATIALHFYIIDSNLRTHYKVPYDRQGRWLLTAAIIFGAIVGQTVRLNPAAISVIWSFLAGSTILNVLKRELPTEQESCFWSFVSGAGVYTTLLLLK